MIVLTAENGAGFETTGWVVNGLTNPLQLGTGAFISEKWPEAAHCRRKAQPGFKPRRSTIS
ncbi:MAG: hypothetical protein CMF26_03705 [Kiloniella sp.]|nr:hypothetical protein [Kiloniella sp.]